MANNVITAVFSSSNITYTKPAYQYDYGMILKFSGIELPQAYEVHFSNTEFCGESISQIGDESGVTIPDEMFLSGAPIYAWTFLHTGLDDGETVYKTVVSINKRAQPSDIEPTPVQQDVITQAIAALNTAIEQTAQDVITSGENAQAAQDAAGVAENARDQAIDAKDKAEDAQEAAETAQEKAEGAQEAAERAAGSVLGLTAEASVDANVGTPSVDVDVSTVSDHKHMEFSFHNLKGTQGDPGQDGQDGQDGFSPTVSVSEITGGHEIEITDKNGTQSFDVMDGKDGADGQDGQDGQDGADGFSPVVEVTEITGGHEVSITDAEGTQTFDVMDGVDGEVTEAELEEALADKADIITASASGEIVTIEDGAKNLPIKSMVVSVEPVQDLHGQDAPYPPGGGENLFQTTATSGTVNGTTFTVNSDGTITVSGTPSAIINGSYVFGEVTLPAGTYKVNGNSIPSDKLRITVYNVTASSAIASFYNNYDIEFTLSAESVIRVYPFVHTDFSGTAITLKPMIRLSSVSDGTFAPYSNVCPISGWTGVDVTRKANNLIGGIAVANRIKDKFGVNATIDTTEKTVSFNPVSTQGYPAILYGTRRSSETVPFPFYYPYKENTRYTFIFKANPNPNGNINLGVSYTDGTTNGGFRSTQLDSNNYMVWTSPSNKTVLSFYAGSYSGKTTLYYDTIGVFEGVVTLDDFTPYEGTEKYEVDWTDEAGTVYGGSYDPVTGVLKSCPYYASYNGETLTGHWISDRDVYAPGATPTTGAQVVNDGGLLTEHQLTPVQIATLLGVNNFWSNSNGQINLEYRADTKLYIEQLTKPTEDDMVANANIASGKFFMVNNRLMLSTTAIAQGEQIVVGTNCSEVSLADALNQINA